MAARAQKLKLSERISLSTDARCGAAPRLQVGKHPKVMLWRPDDLQRVQTLTHKNCRAVIALAFSPDASQLLACGADNQHTIHVWDWKKGSLLCCMPGQNGTPPQVHLLSRPG